MVSGAAVASLHPLPSPPAAEALGSPADRSGDFTAERRAVSDDAVTALYAKNVQRYIHVRTPDQALRLRRRLIDYVWRGPGFPAAARPAAVTRGISAQPFGLANARSVDRLTIEMRDHVHSFVYVFHPAEPAHKLFVYVEGHVLAPGLPLGRATMDRFLAEGYTVIGMDMPLMGGNNHPVVKTRFGFLRLKSHEDLKFLATRRFSPLRFFVEPIAAAINYARAQERLQTIALAGISGGGWTTTLYAAMDPRVRRSYPVAGSLPLPLVFTGTGHYEQSVPQLYSIADYPDLYVLGAYGRGRRQLQLLNVQDPCCFNGTAYTSYADAVARRVRSLGGGSFRVAADPDNREHSISPRTLDEIDRDLALGSLSRPFEGGRSAR